MTKKKTKKTEMNACDLEWQTVHVPLLLNVI